MLRMALRGAKARVLRHLGIDGLGERLARVSAQLDAVGRDIAAVPKTAVSEQAIDGLTATCGRVERNLAEVLDPRIQEIVRADKTGKVITLEYPPSYDYRPRWGYTRPPHAGLTRLFARQDADYLRTAHGLAAHLPQFRAIKREFSHDTPGEAGWLGGPVNTLDSAVLYHYMTALKPRTYLEIGSGLTTMFAARAKRDHGLATRLVSIDPTPRAWVDGLCDEVIREPFECTDLAPFAALEPGDVVFMDGSHRSFTNSDVTVFMLDVLPTLKPGVVVHIHDIALPVDYPEMFLSWHWNEQYLLACYLLGAGDKIDYLMPVNYASRLPDFRAAIAPVLDWWGSDRADSWLSGGSIWFTHR